MIKKLLKYSILFIGFCFILIYASSVYIENTTENLVYSSIHNIPKTKVGVVLGTSKYISNGYVNLYYKYRVQATYELYNNGKIEFILISGDNGSVEYDEPSAFKEDLIKLGIPENKIYLDYAGFRTLDSVIRANKVFGLNEFIVISQKFHNQRAVYLASQKGIITYGYNAKDVNQHYGFKTNIREKLARVKAVIDVVFNVQPKYLGEKIEIK